MQDVMELAPSAARPQHRPHVCPWWLGWTLVLPFRHWTQKPESWLEPLARTGCRALEVGPGTGFFTVPLAELVGSAGKVWCVDLQPRMLTTLGRRLRRRGLAERVSLRTCSADDLGVTDLADTMDLAVLIYVLHEVPDPARTLAQVVSTLRVGGRLLLVEPRGHCSAQLFAEQLRIAHDLGLVARDDALAPKLRSLQAAVLEKVQRPLVR
ncbi:MAG: methyltransferase domain-containing protein [Polyangiaceae bacterium]|nr:methyltransferase domain-containing protein [Polyangiaceae bacterium]